MREFTLEDLNRLATTSLGADDRSEFTTDRLDTDFQDLGYDSLAIYELVSILQDELQVAISDQEVDELRTPRTVLRFVNARRVVQQ